MRLTARLAGAGALAVAATLPAAVPAEAAPTAALGQCTTTRGTIVAVDFGHWGGPIVRGCGVQPDGQPDSTGYRLLGDGGFGVAGTRSNPAFICRLGSGSFQGGTPYPTPAQDPCNVTPPASASWSFWLAPPGATTWRYSDGGATSDHPVSGGVELWTFGGTSTSGTSGSAVPANSLIDQLRAHNTSPSGGPAGATQAPPTTAPPPAIHGGTGTSGGSTGYGAVPPAGASSRPPTLGSATPGSAGATSPRAGGVASAAGTGPTSDQPSIVSAQARPSTRSGGGSALPVVIAVLVAAGLAGAGGLSLLRRRRAPGD